MTPQAVALLSIPQSHKTILTALATFGAYQGDTNDNSSVGFTLQVEADEMYTAPGYASANCPASSTGIPCTPLTAWANALGPTESGVTWTGTNYNIDISKDVPNLSLAVVTASHKLTPKENNMYPVPMPGRLLIEEFAEKTVTPPLRYLSHLRS
jgi:hypothetical protein